VAVLLGDIVETDHVSLRGGKKEGGI
jgi:hypothetical protein